MKAHGLTLSCPELYMGLHDTLATAIQVELAKLMNMVEFVKNLKIPKYRVLILISMKNVHCKVAILMITFLPLRIFSQTVLLQGGIQGELAGMSTASSCN